MVVFVVTYSVRFPYEGDEALRGTYGVASTPENAHSMMEECKSRYRTFECDVEMESFELDQT